ncbi:retrovirus-related pol polyprotein from transposon TNT 1-94 [Tanacetum coccineum]
MHTRYNKTPYELIKNKKPNVRYFHMFGSLCCPTNDRDDIGKMKPKAGIGIFIGYSESSRGFRIYNRKMRKIMETIHVKFNEKDSGHKLNCSNFQDLLEDSNETPSKEDLDNLFGPLYKEYYELRSPEVSTNSATNTLNNEETPSSSSIIVEENKAPQIVSSSVEPIVNDPTTLFLNDNVDESVQEDTAEFDRYTFINPFCSPVLEKSE